MSLKLLIEKLEDVAEPLRELYTKTEDGKFRLGVDGIEDPTQLKKALSAERKIREEKERALKAYEGIDDPEAARKLLANIGDDDDLKLWQSGQKDVVRARWVEKTLAESAKVKKADEDEKTKLREQLNRRYEKSLADEIRKAAAKVGVHAQAIDDAILRGRGLFSLDADDNAVQLRDGSVILGKDGKTPYSPTEWLESMREVAPHWFPAMGSGGGSQQGSRQSNGSGQKTLKRSAFDQLSHKDRAAAMKEGVQLIDG